MGRPGVLRCPRRHAVKPPRLAIVQEKSDATAGLPPDPAGRMEALRAALLREAELAVQLRDEMIRQRGAVASGQPAAVDSSSDATSRLLLALDEAGRRRGEIVAALTGDAAVPLDRLEVQLGHSLPPAVESARLTLRRAAADVSREASINRVVLRRAVEAGEAFLQDLFSGGELRAPSYGEQAPAPPPAPAGRLLDRTA